MNRVVFPKEVMKSRLSTFSFNLIQMQNRLEISGYCPAYNYLPFFCLDFPEYRKCPLLIVVPGSNDDTQVNQGLFL